MIDLTVEKPITMSAAAKHCGVTPWTAYQWVKQGLETIQLGKKKYTSLEALNRFGQRGNEEATEIMPTKYDAQAVREFQDKHGVHQGAGRNAGA